MEYDPQKALLPWIPHHLFCLQTCLQHASLAENIEGQRRSHLILRLTTETAYFFQTSMPPNYHPSSPYQKSGRPSSYF